MKQLVLPIKDSNILHEVEDTLLNNFKAGRRSYTIFQVGKATLLRVSDVLALRRTEIFNNEKWAAGPRYLNMTVYHGIEKAADSEEAGKLKLVK